MSYTLSAVLNSLIVVGMLLGWIRFRKIQPSFHPFILLLTFGFLHESISLLLVALHYSNAVVYNMYTLAEAVLILWQFKQWGIVPFKRKWFSLLLLTLLTAWLVENFYLSTIFSFSSYFIILYSFIVVLMAIKILNVLIVEEQSRLWQNPIFLICAGFLLYFTYSIMIETFWMYGLNRDAVFQSHVYDILVVINLLVNLVYTVAVLWIPTKPKFILLS